MVYSFIIGSFIFGQLAHRVRTRRRSWLLLTTFFQAMLVLVVALVERSGVPGQETGPRALAIVGLLSFAQAGQVSLAIGVGLAELNTTMITGAVVSFPKNPPYTCSRCLPLCSDLYPWRPAYLSSEESCARPPYIIRHCIPRRLLRWQCTECIRHDLGILPCIRHEDVHLCNVPLYTRHGSGPGKTRRRGNTDTSIAYPVG